MAVLVLLNGFLACVFAESAYHKLRDMGAFGAALADYRLLRARPGARRVARAATPAAELVLAGALLTPAVATAATYAAAPLLVLFLVLLVSDDRPAFDNCGCASKEPVPVPRRAFPLAHVALELPLIMHIHEVERRHLPERVRQARRVYGLDGDAVAERQPG